MSECSMISYASYPWLILFLLQGMLPPFLSFFPLFFQASQVALVVKNMPANAGDPRNVG